MKIKKLCLLIGFSLALASCSNFSGSNISTKDSNLNLDSYREEKNTKAEALSTDNENISSIINDDKENVDSKDKQEKNKEIDIEDWKEKLVKFGEFDQDFVDGLAKDRIKDLVKEAEGLADKTGYWDIKDFVFQELANDFPDSSKKFPLDSIEQIYDWEIKDDDQNTDKYQTERSYLVGSGLDENLAYSLSNKDLKEAFKKAYEENEDGYYEDYIKAVADSYKENSASKNDSQAVEPMYDNPQDYEEFKKVMVENYEFDADIVANMPNSDLDIANARAQKRLEETGFGDIGLIYDEIGKMYPGASTMYTGR